MVRYRTLCERGYIGRDRDEESRVSGRGDEGSRGTYTSSKSAGDPRKQRRQNFNTVTVLYDLYD